MTPKNEGWMDSLSEKYGCSKCQYKTYRYDCKAVELS